MTDNSNAPFSVLHGRLCQNFTGIFKPLQSRLGPLFIPKLLDSGPAPNPFGVQAQPRGASDLGLDPVPSAPQAATSDRQYREWKEWPPRTRLTAASGKSWKGRALAEAPIGCGSHPRTNSWRVLWRHNSRLPASRRCSPWYQLCLLRPVPSSVEPIPRPMPGHCGLRREEDETSCGRGAEADQTVPPLAQPGRRGVRIRSTWGTLLKSRQRVGQ